jgi:hypothetical protein
VRRRAFLALASAAGWGGPVRGARGWLLLDYDAVFCGACLAPVPALLQALPASVQERFLTAIIVFDDRRRDGPGTSRRRLVEAKWDGLCRLHGWTLPAVLEPGSGFRTLLGGRPSRLLLFDLGSRTSEALDPPLSRSALDHVLSLLLQ